MVKFHLLFDVVPIPERSDLTARISLPQGGATISPSKLCPGAVFGPLSVTATKT